jgi:hypothetical protein
MINIENRVALKYEFSNFDQQGQSLICSILLPSRNGEFVQNVKFSYYGIIEIFVQRKNLIRDISMFFLLPLFDEVLSTPLLKIPKYQASQPCCRDVMLMTAPVYPLCRNNLESL